MAVHPVAPPRTGRASAGPRWVYSPLALARVAVAACNESPLPLGASCGAMEVCGSSGGGQPLSCCEGQCVDLDTSLQHCGACGRRCNRATPQSEVSCEQGRCLIHGCAGGWGDCDGQSANGCETDLARNPAHCGSCGRTCGPGVNGAPACIEGRCAIVCYAGFGDCNGSAADGCESDLRGDPLHCGACDNRCAATGANRSPGCVGATCRDECTRGYADCVADPRHDCETSTSSDPANCGRCGAACPPGMPSCVDGVCSINNTVLLVHTSALHASVKALLEATHAFSRVDEFDAAAGTPAANLLGGYGAALVFGERGALDPKALGDALADYVDDGGAVVMAYAANSSKAVSGRFGLTYSLLGPGNDEVLADRLGVVHEPNSALMAGVKSLSAAKAVRSTSTVQHGGISVADWSILGRPMVVRGTINGHNLVSLNLRPVPVDADPDAMVGDLAPLLRNALLFR